MEFIFICILSMLCACACILQPADSSVLIKTGSNGGYDTLGDGNVQKASLPSEGNAGVNHDKTRHVSHPGNTNPGHSHITDVDDVEHMDPAFSKTLDELPDHATVDDSVHSAEAFNDEMHDIINENDEETVSSNSKTLANLADHPPDDERPDSSEIVADEKQDVLHEKEKVSKKSDLEQDGNEQKHVMVDDLSTGEQTTECPRCNKEINETEVNIEMIKQHLLQKLGLSVAPQVDGPLPPLPFDFYAGEDFSVNDEDIKDGEEKARSNVKTRQIFLFGEDITDTCFKKKGTGCYSFNTTISAIDPDRVASIELWIYKQPDVNDHHIQEFMVSELEPYYSKGGKKVLRSRNIVKRLETRLKYGWMKIYVKRSVMRWLSKPHRNHGLAVVCKTCQRQNHKTIYGNKEGYMPILVFYMKQHTHWHSRSRRHTQCIEGGRNCCHRETLEINFHDIGWDYIMTPERIRPNFCMGSCNGIQAAYYNHTRVVQTLQQSVGHSIGAIQTCCSPVSFARPQSLLYRDNHGIVRKVDVPDLIVGECGCT